MMTLVKKAMPFVIVIGIFGYILSVVFKFNTLVTSFETSEGLTMYKIDLVSYLNNFNKIYKASPPPFETLLPQRTWRNSTNITDWFPALVNNIALVFQWLYMPINFVLYLVRWFSYAWMSAFVAIGWPMDLVAGSETQYQSTIITILAWIQQNLMIPYF